MEKLNKRQMPLVVAEAFEELQKECEKISLEYLDLLHFDYANAFINFRDSAPESDFFLTIDNPRQDTDNKLCVNISYKPKTQSVPGEYVRQIVMTEVPQAIRNWAAILERYNVVTFDRKDKFLKKYEDEYTEFLGMQDPDADMAPLQEQNQIALYNALELLEEKLKSIPEQTDDTKHIIQDIESLQKNIPNLTKNAVVKGLSKIMARIRKAGPKLLSELMDIAKKEAFKFMIKEGADFLNSVAHHLHVIN